MSSINDIAKYNVPDIPISFVKVLTNNNTVPPRDNHYMIINMQDASASGVDMIKVVASHGSGNVDYEKSFFIDPDTLLDLKDDVLTMGAYIASPTFMQEIKNIAEIWKSLTFGVEEGSYSVEIDNKELHIQANNLNKISKNLFSILKSVVLTKAKSTKKDTSKYVVTPDPAFLANPDIVSEAVYHLASSTPAIAFLGPSGSGKTNYAYAIGAATKGFGYGWLRIDCNSALDVDEFFNYVNITSKTGITIKKGIIVKAVEEMRSLGLKPNIIMNEFNSLSDNVRRIFYSIFDSHNRSYTIQHSEVADGDEGATTDFSDVSFLLTGNPMKIQYEQDDLRSFSAAELRRIVCIDVPYEVDMGTLKNIIKNIVKFDPATQSILRGYPSLLGEINWDVAVDLHRKFNPINSVIPHDVSYTAVAKSLLQATVLSTTPTSPGFNTELGKALNTYVFTGIKNEQVKDTLMDEAQNTGAIFPKKDVSNV